jgi:hypothetical protein
MAKNTNEPDQISTTDKLKAFNSLKSAGYRVEMNGSGVPTVVCPRVEDMDRELKNVKKVLKELRYNGSFGVRGPRKTDAIMTEETAAKEENIEILTA